VRKCWKTIVGIDCILILIAKEIPYELRDEKDNIILFPPLPHIPTAFQAQCIRLLYPSLLIKKYQGIIISDMDIIPLNKDYFVSSIEALPDDAFCIYRDVIPAEIKQYPMCYCVASSETWGSIFDIAIKNDIVEKLTAWYSKDDYEVSSPYSEMWAQDQKQLFLSANKYSAVVVLSDEKTGFSRLDRIHMNFIYNNTDKIKTNIANGNYADFHLPRPYETHKKMIHELISINDLLSNFRDFV
jgi:hypothetical protein